MTYFDAHCDTISKLFDEKQELYENNFHLDIKRMSKQKHIQVFAAFVDKKNDILPPFKRCNQLIDFYNQEIDKNTNHIRHCNTLNQIIQTVDDGQTASMLAIEGGEALHGNIDNLKYFYDKGVRFLTLCWNYRNEIAEGVGEDSGQGLTKFGKSVIDEMNRLGMVIDVSHISVNGFWDTVERSKTPIVATHSNSFAIKRHKRNLDDEQIKAIIKNGGCIGINLYCEFLDEKSRSIKDILNHIEHILSLGGENNIGIGSDFDGMSLLPDEICGVEDVYKIFDEMLRVGYSENIVKKIASDNFLRVLGIILK